MAIEHEKICSDVMRMSIFSPSILVAMIRKDKDYKKAKILLSMYKDERNLPTDADCDISGHEVTK